MLRSNDRRGRPLHPNNPSSSAAASVLPHPGGICFCVRECACPQAAGSEFLATEERKRELRRRHTRSGGVVHRRYRHRGERAEHTKHHTLWRARYSGIRRRAGSGVKCSRYCVYQRNETAAVLTSLDEARDRQASYSHAEDAHRCMQYPEGAEITTLFCFWIDRDLKSVHAALKSEPSRTGTHARVHPRALPLLLLLLCATTGTERSMPRVCLYCCS